MQKILITGFKNFGDYNENTTEALSKSMRFLGSHIVDYIIFHVKIFSNGAKNYGKQIITRAIISLGMASDIYGVRIKSKSINWVESKKYCLPEENKQIIDKNLPPKHQLDIDLSKWNIEKNFFSI